MALFSVSMGNYPEVTCKCPRCDAYADEVAWPVNGRYRMSHNGPSNGTWSGPYPRDWHTWTVPFGTAVVDDVRGMWLD